MRIVLLFVMVAAAACTSATASIAASVLDVQLSRESVMYAIATIAVENTGAGDCRVSEYTLTWPGGTKRVQPDNFEIAGGARLERTVRVSPADGDLHALDGRATIAVTCE